jgi:hypothetical protein
VLEGELQFPLADGQQISGFALDINGEMRDAVPVPKDRGRQVFEEIARRGVDPGLLEQTAGNQFRLRIYPLPAGGSRRVQLVMREPLAFAGQGWQWTLPLQFAAGAASVELKLQAPGATTAGTAPFRISAGQLQWQGKGAQLPQQLQWNLPAERRRRCRWRLAGRPLSAGAAAGGGQQYAAHVAQRDRACCGTAPVRRASAIARVSSPCWIAISLRWVTAAWR